MAWTIAALGRAKKMPDLKKLLGPARREREAASKPKSIERLWAMARIWAAATAAGGEEG